MPVTVTREGDVAWVTIDAPPVNATTTAVRAGLLSAVQEVQGARLAVLTCAGRTFVAGGDMAEFDAPPQEPHLPDVVDAIEASEVPFAALMHGTVLGGGFEIAMACGWRFARPGTRFGLPEVNVGLIPGAGGSLRAPRLLGWEAAVDMACLGKMLTADQMLALGALDGIVEGTPDFAAECTDRPLPVSHRSIAPPDEAALRRKVAKAAKGAQAPLLNLDALLRATRPYPEAQPEERAQHLALRASAESVALRHAFFAERQVARPAIVQGVAPAPVNRVAIVGGGLMGRGIAAACLGAGHDVTLIEQTGQAAEAAHKGIAGLLQGAVDRGKASPQMMQAQIARLTASHDMQAAAGADLAIEAVFEDLTAKRSVMAELAQVLRPDALLATNTSYLDPNAIFDGIAGPGRCLGLHFFSPAHIMKLVEVVQTRGTSAETLATGFAFAKGLRKLPVLSAVCDGFIGNRILAAYRRAAEYLLADGAWPEDIDAAMRAFGMAMGPFQAQDMAGLQIAYANRRRQDATRPASERYVPLGDRLCDAGRMGQRNGAGWYTYEPGSRTPAPAPEVRALIEAYRLEAGLTPRSYSAAEIQTRLVAVMANEGARIVEEGIAQSDAAVDVVKIAGYGFPRWRGGPMHWATAQGDAVIRTALDGLEQDSPGAWTRAQRFA